MPNSQCLCLTFLHLTLAKACTYKAQTTYMGGRNLERPVIGPSRCDPRRQSWDLHIRLSQGRWKIEEKRSNMYTEQASCVIHNKNTCLTSCTFYSLEILLSIANLASSSWGGHVNHYNQAAPQLTEEADMQSISRTDRWSE